MDIKQVAEGLNLGKKYNLPDWGRFYIYEEENAIIIRSPHTEPMVYSLHIDEILSNEWREFNK